MSFEHRRASISGRRASGFTLMELLITIALVAILVALALPNFREFMIRMNVSEATNGLVHALNIARSEAVKRGRPVIVEPIEVGDWSKGWVVRCEECAMPGNPGDPMEDQEISRFEKPAEYVVAGTEGTLQFGGSGALAGEAISFRICRPLSNPKPEENRLVEVLVSGVISSRRRGDADPETNAPPSCG